MTEISEQKSPAREAAEVAKILLEAEKLKADIESVKIEQRLKEAEARKALAAAMEAEHDAEMRKIRLEENKRGEALVAVTDFYQHIYVFDQTFSRASVNSCLNTLNAWHRTDANKAWNLVVDSPGGDAVAGMHLFDEIVGHSLRGGGTHHVTIKVRGMAASMGGILVQAADERVMGHNAWCLVHEVASGAIGKLGELKDEIRFLERMCDRIANIFVARSDGAISLEEFQAKWTRSDWWLSSEEMITLNFADRIG